MDPFSLAALVAPATPVGIVDVGASFLTEPPPYEPLLEAGLARLVAFEPNEAECARLRAMYGPPHRIYPYFIGDGSAAVFYETNKVATGSLYKPNRALLEKFQGLHEQVTLVAEHPVQTRALDGIPDLGDIDYLKLDVQGAELAVLQGAQRLLEGVVMLQLEVELLELYEKQPLFSDVDRYLRAQGFLLLRFSPFQSLCLKPMLMAGNLNAGNQQLWADALYIRNWIEPGSMPPEKLVKLALIAHDLYNLGDFSHFMLSRLDVLNGSRYAPAYLERLVGSPTH